MIRYMLDTCVISEPLRRRPDKKLVDWWRNQNDLSLYISALVVGEIEKGIRKLPQTRKREALTRTLEELIEQFDTRVLPIDTAVARRWGQLVSDCEGTGRPVPAVDGLIAATALAYDLVVVTRNTDDFAPTGVKTLNPFSKE